MFRHALLFSFFLVSGLLNASAARGHHTKRRLLFDRQARCQTEQLGIHASGPETSCAKGNPLPEALLYGGVVLPLTYQCLDRKDRLQYQLTNVEPLFGKYEYRHSSSWRIVEKSDL